MAAESTYYESLASVRYVEGAKIGNRTMQTFARSGNAVHVVYRWAEA